MSTTNPIFRPAAGMRFSIRGAEFEVAFVAYGMVRYAAVNGGKSYRVTYDRFSELQTSNEITVINGGLFGEHADGGGPNLANLTETEMATAMRQLRYAENAQAALTHPNSIAELQKWLPVFAAEIKESKVPPARTVSSWVKKLREHGKEAFMAPNRRRGNTSLRFAPEVENLILQAVDAYMVEEKHGAEDVLAYIAGHLAEQNLLTKDGSQVKIPCPRSIRRKLQRLDPFLLIRIKQGPVAADRAARAAGKSIISPRPLYIVEIDTHYLDIFVVDPDTGEILGRPFLVIALDIRTRCVVGIYISLFPPSTTTTLAVLKDMLTRPNRGLPGGVCVYLFPDNGIEFKNCGVTRLTTKLMINFQPAEIRDPNDKPHVESFFSTLTLYLIHKIPGTTFSNPGERGDYPSEKRACVTLDQLKVYINRWIEEEYHIRPHSSTGRSPIRMWQEETTHAKPLALLDAEVDAIARRVKRCAINKGRVRIHHNYYYSHALRTLEEGYSGLVNVLYDELNLDHVYVEHPDEKGTLIQADSVNPEYTSGLTLWQHLEARKLKTQMTQDDINAIGKYADVLARYQLLQMIQKDSVLARKKIARLTQGRGRKAEVSAMQPLASPMAMPALPAIAVDIGSPGFIGSPGDKTPDSAVTSIKSFGVLKG